MKPAVLARVGKMMMANLLRYLLTALLLFLTGCDKSPQIYQLSGSVMGTTYHVAVVSDKPLPQQIADGVKAQLVNIDLLMSTYKENSEINQLNRLAVGQALPVSNEMLEVLAVSREVSEYTSGAFEPTVAPLVDLWGFGPEKKDQYIPDSRAIAEQQARVGLFHLVDQGNTLIKHADVRLDFSAVAKGYAVDVASDFLRRQGFINYLVEVGGEMRLSGLKPDGEKWRVGIESPQSGQSTAQLVIAVTDVAVATSGDYRNYFEREGQRYSHTIDPRTGYPIKHKLASVTVIADNAALADALATGFSVLGDKKSLLVAEELGLPVYLLVKDGDEFIARYSPAFEPYLQ